MKKKVKKVEKKKEHIAEVSQKIEEPKLEAKIEEVKEEIKDDLEILEEEIIKSIKVKGKNGLYNGNTNTGVTLEGEGYKLTFKNKEELKGFYDEINKVFERI